MSAPALDERSSKALDYAQEGVKQVLSLAIGIITLTVPFFKTFAGARSALARHLMLTAWIFLGISALAGVAGLLTMASNLWKKQPAERNQTPDIWTRDIRLTGVVQMVAFAFGLVFTVWAGADAL